MRNYILGGGVTGLAAGISSGLPVFEAVDEPGGICSSYYVRPGSQERLAQVPDDGEAYRFEIGGGHWIFGGDPTILQFLRTIAPLKPITAALRSTLPIKRCMCPIPFRIICAIWVVIPYARYSRNW